MSGAKPNHDYLKLAVKVLAMILTSGAVTTWLSGETEIKVAGNRNLVDAAGYEATWAANQIMELRERVRKLELAAP